NQPYGTAFERLCALTFPEGHPYAHTPIGSMEDLDATTLEDCADFFATWYAPGNAVLSVVGDVDPERTIEAVERYFGGIPSGPEKPPARPGDLGPLSGVREETVDEEVPSPAYFAMFTLPADGGDDIEAAELAVEILGGGSGSRLYDRMVRRDQIATEVWAGVTRLASGPSLAIVEAIEPDPEKISAVLDEELRRFAEHGPDADETARATAQAERGFLEQTETVTGLANALSQNATQFGDPARVLTAPGRAAAVTGDAVTALAGRRAPAPP